MVMKKDNLDKAMDVLEKQYNMESGTMPMSAEQEEKYAAMIKEVVSGNDSRKSDMRNKKEKNANLLSISQSGNRSDLLRCGWSRHSTISRCGTTEDSTVFLLGRGKKYRAGSFGY